MSLATRTIFIASAIFILLVIVISVVLTHEDAPKTTFKAIEEEVVLTSKLIDEVCSQTKHYSDSCYPKKNKNICDYEIFVKLNELHGISESQFSDIMETCNLSDN